MTGIKLKSMTNVEINKRAKLSQHLTSSSVATLGHSSELDGSRLSPHFTLGELTKTNAKTADGNIPSHVHIENLKRLCGWLEMLRSEYNRRYGGLSPDPSLSREGSRDQEEPIIINSGYRSEAVNKAVGGVAGSNHLTGCAVDIHCMGKEQAIRYACILLDIADGKKMDFDELILEKRGTTIWVHFAVRPKGNRRYVDF
jgi:uncharacterized protein YcbK (DUF882 family)